VAFGFLRRSRSGQSSVLRWLSVRGEGGHFANSAPGTRTENPERTLKARATRQALFGFVGTAPAAGEICGK
jgi:hypothetical protein